MKKTIFILLIFIFALSLNGCTDQSLDSIKNEPKNDSTVNEVASTKTDSINNSAINNQQKNMNTEQKKYRNQSEQIDLLSKYDKAILKTNLGDIKIKFYENSPITVNNFLNLAEQGYYDEIKFHRVINNFMIQGGDQLTKNNSMRARWGTGGPGYAIEDEFIDGLSNKKGTIAMANSGPGTGGSQFFINLVDNDYLDWNKEPLASKHPVFGEVIEGMDVVEKIGKVKTAGQNVPVEDVVINTVELLEK